MASDRVQRQLDRLLDEVDEAMTQLDWEQVRDRSQAVLALDPENEDALRFLAASERALGTSAPSPMSKPATPTPATKS